MKAAIFKLVPEEGVRLGRLRQHLAQHAKGPFTVAGWIEPSRRLKIVFHQDDDAFAVKVRWPYI